MKLDVNHIFSTTNKDISWLKENTIFLTVHGSHAYGLNTAQSDIDVRGIAIPPKSYFFGFQNNFDHWVTKEPYDNQVFDLIKFFNLTKDGNPNTLELLFTEPEDHILVSDAGKVLLENRDLFLSRNLKERYIGYAKAQAHRMKNHKEWIDQGEVKPPPSREEFGLKAKPEIDREQYLTVQALIDKKLDGWNCDFEPFSDPQKIYLQDKVSSILTEMNILSDEKWMLAARSLGMDENFIHGLQKEKAYNNLHANYNSYLDWKAHRNPERAKLEAKIGYDAKHATQLIRLLKLGEEVLLTAKLRVKRLDDREELMEIKNCLWPYDRLIAYADEIEARVKAAYFKSPLPVKPDIKKLDALCIQLVERALGR